MNFLWGSEAAAPTPVVSADGKVYSSANDVDFAAFGAENVQILLARESGADGVTTWELVDEQPDGVKIWRGEVRENAWSPFKASRIISADTTTIQNALLDPVLLLELDDMTERVTVLQDADTADARISLRHLVSKGVFPIAAREFVIVTIATSLPDASGLVIASRSIGVDGIAGADGAVRAVNLVSGYIIHELPSVNGKPRCEVTLLAHADLQGYIPATVVNMLGTSATVKILANLQTIVESR